MYRPTLVALMMLIGPSAFAQSRATSESGSFNNPANAMDTSSSTYAYSGSKTSTCGDPTDYYVAHSWTDFPALGFGRFGKLATLSVTYKGFATSLGKGDITLCMDFTTDGGTTWRPLSCTTYTSGNTSLSKATVSRKIGANRVTSLEVRAYLDVQNTCPGLVGSYGGSLTIFDIVVN